MDLVRLRDETLHPAYEGQPVLYRAYSCRAGTYQPVQELAAQPLVILEGSYSLHPRLRALYDMTVFCTVPPELQRQRLQARNPAALNAFLTRWIPLEEQYIAATAPMESCDFVIFCAE